MMCKKRNVFLAIILLMAIVGIFLVGITLGVSLREQMKLNNPEIEFLDS